MFSIAAGEDISGPNLALVGPSVSVNKIASLDIEAVDGDDAKVVQRMNKLMMKGSLAKEINKGE